MHTLIGMKNQINGHKSRTEELLGAHGRGEEYMGSLKKGFQLLLLIFRNTRPRQEEGADSDKSTYLEVRIIGIDDDTESELDVLPKYLTRITARSEGILTDDAIEDNDERGDGDIGRIWWGDWIKFKSEQGAYG